MNIHHSPAAVASRAHHAASHQKPAWSHPGKKDARRSPTVAGRWPKEACPSLEQFIIELRIMTTSSECYVVHIRVVKRKTRFILYTNSRKCSFRGMWRSELHQCLRDKAARTLTLCLREHTTKKKTLSAASCKSNRFPNNLHLSLLRARHTCKTRQGPGKQQMSGEKCKNKAERDCPKHFPASFR